MPNHEEIAVVPIPNQIPFNSKRAITGGKQTQHPSVTQEFKAALLRTVDLKQPWLATARGKERHCGFALASVLPRHGRVSGEMTSRSAFRCLLMRC